MTNSAAKDLNDYRVLYDAADILKSRSRKPDGLALRIATKILIDTAHKIAKGNLPILRTLTEDTKETGNQ